MHFIEQKYYVSYNDRNIEALNHNYEDNLIFVK